MNTPDTSDQMLRAKAANYHHINSNSSYRGTCFICKQFFHTENCSLLETLTSQQMKRWARSAKACKGALIRRMPSSSRLLPRGCCCSCCNCDNCTAIVYSFIGILSTGQGTSFSLPELPQQPDSDLCDLDMSSAVDNFGGWTSDNFQVQQFQEAPLRRQSPYDEYLCHTLGRISANIHAISHRAKPEIIISGKYYSVCMPVVIERQDQDRVASDYVESAELWCTTRFHNEDCRNLFFPPGEYHSSHIFRNVQFACGRICNIGLCDCRLDRNSSGDNHRKLIETIMHEIFYRSDAYTYSEFMEYVENRLESTLVLGSQFSHVGEEGYKRLECIHTQVLLEAMLCNEIASRREEGFEIQPPYPDIWGYSRQ